MRAIILLACLAAAAPAGGQAFRDGLPAVLPAIAASPAIADPIDDGALRARYVRAGSPRIIVFWNRDLTDSVTSSHRLELDGTTQASAREDIDHDWSGRTRTVEASGSSRMTIAASRIDEGRRSGPAETDDWALEQGFNRLLMQNGIRLVDRVGAVRASALGAAGGDTLTAETAALRGKADLLLQVLQAPAGTAADGYLFKIKITDVRTGALVANLVTPGRPPQRRARLVAGAQGYERDRLARPTSEAIGSQVARETLSALSRSW